MGNIKYSEMYSSNGRIFFPDEEHKIHEKGFDVPYKYIKFFDFNGQFRVYLNDSKSFFELNWDTGNIEFQDFFISKIRIESIDPSLDIRYLQYIVLR